MKLRGQVNTERPIAMANAIDITAARDVGPVEGGVAA
jgi:hypothetical protein